MTWVRLIELAVALILAPAALSKALDVKRFVTALRRLDVVPSSLSVVVALATIGVEIALAALLVAGVADVPTLIAAALLFAAFAGIAWLEASRREGDEPMPECGCLGGVLRLRMGKGSASLNLLVAFAAAGAAIGAAANPGGAVELALADLVLLATLVAGIYWLAHYALSVVSAMEIRMKGTGDLT
jgi:hypothetical protein